MNNIKTHQREYSSAQLIALTFLRVLIGWHFLYEGLVKLYTPGGWSAELFLANSVGPFSPVFKALTSNPAVLNGVNQANIWGLIAIGLSLFLGIYAKPFKCMGMILLFLYYLAYPPFAAYQVSAPVEGSYWIVNKNLVELGALLVLYYFPSSHITGLDRYLKQIKFKK
jgi:thiosulfate dehydrogenase (quinone) large subunit